MNSSHQAQLVHVFCDTSCRLFCLQAGPEPSGQGETQRRQEETEAAKERSEEEGQVMA